MTGELEVGSVVEIAVAKFVFVAVVLDSDASGVRLEMDGCLKNGAVVSIFDPAADCRMQGAVLECTACDTGGFRIHVAKTTKYPAESNTMFVWPANALQYAGV